MGGENLQKYFCRPLPSAAGPAYYYEIYVGGNNPARALVPGERQATLDQGSDLINCLLEGTLLEQIHTFVIVSQTTFYTIDMN